MSKRKDFKRDLNETNVLFAWKRAQKKMGGMHTKMECNEYNITRLRAYKDMRHLKTGHPSPFSILQNGKKNIIESDTQKQRNCPRVTMLSSKSHSFPGIKTNGTSQEWLYMGYKTKSNDFSNIKYHVSSHMQTLWIRGGCILFWISCFVRAYLSLITLTLSLEQEVTQALSPVLLCDLS